MNMNQKFYCPKQIIHRQNQCDKDVMSIMDLLSEFDKKNNIGRNNRANIKP